MRICVGDNVKGKKKEYSLPNVYINKKNQTACIGCLSNWYTIEEFGKLKIYVSDFIDLKNYLTTIPESNKNCINGTIEIKVQKSSILVINQLIYSKTESKTEKIRSDSDSTSNSEVAISLMDTSDDLSSVESEDDSSLEQIKEKKIDITFESYFAVYYDKNWYVGRVTGKEREKFVIKFLKQNLQKYMWPKIEDIQSVDKKFIFYGPIKLLGNGPFTISRIDLININKIYKDMKRSFK